MKMADNNKPEVTKNEKFKEEMMFNAMSMRGRLLEKLMDPRRDLDDECGYPKDTDPQEYRELYDKEAVANRVVEILPSESWKNCPDVYEDEDAETETEFEKAWDDLASKMRGRSWFQGDRGHPAWEFLKRADILSGVGSFGILLLGLDDGKDLSQPVRGVEEKFSKPIDLSKPEKPVGNSGLSGTYELTTNADETKGRKLLFVRAFDESLVMITQYESNPTSPRYGQPVMYAVTFNDPNERNKGGIGLPMAVKNVHWTRVVHLADNLGSSEIFGCPRMKPVMPRLLDLRKLYGGSAEMYWRGAFPGYSIESHPQLGGDVIVDAAAMREQMEQYSNGLQRYLSLMGMSAKSLAPQVVDPTPQIKTQIEAICIQLAVPMRIFVGSERGELASSQDSGSWNDRMRERQDKYLTTRVIAPFVDKLIMVGVLPEPAGGYRVEWPDLEALSELEKSQIAVARTEALSKYVQGNVEALIAPMDYLTRIMEMSEEEADEILESTTEHLEEVQPDSEGPIVPGRMPKPPAPEPTAPGPMKVKEGETLVDPQSGEEVGKSQPPFVKNAYNPNQPRDAQGRFGSGGAGGGGKVHEDTGLPLNEDGTVTLYHGTTDAGAKSIEKSGKLKSAGEPDVYVTTDPEGGDYGDGTVVKVRVRPDDLMLDDEFPDGRKDFRLSTGKPGGSVNVVVENKVEEEDEA